MLGCLSDSCDSENGICTDTSECKPGWQPRQPKCDIGILMKKIILYQKVTHKFIDIGLPGTSIYININKYINLYKTSLA
jgi:hypothetical protein